jgi:hypothetical protein
MEALVRNTSWLWFFDNELSIMFCDGKAKAKVEPIDADVRSFSLASEIIPRAHVLSLIRDDPHFAFKTVFSEMGIYLMYRLVFGNASVISFAFYVELKK